MELIEMSKKIKIEKGKQLPGARKGMTREKLMASMTEEDWVNVDKIKEANERYTENEAAYKLFILSDQAVVEKDRIKRSMYKALVEILDKYNQMKKHKADILVGETEVKFNDGTVMSMGDLENAVLSLNTQIEQILALIRADGAKLYTFVNGRGLDMKIYFTMEDYNEIIKDIVCKLKNTPYRLY